MAPIKIIVQGIPACRDDFSSPETCMNEDKSKLERLLAKYGPVKCTYLWTPEAADLHFPTRNVVDRFAHMFFKNYEDSERACEAACNHEIQIADCLLTLTPVPNSLVPIDILNENCLSKIFSKLDPEDRFTVEEVCPYWNEIAQDSWSSMKKLDLSQVRVTEIPFETYLVKCGRYIEEITCGILSTVFLELICTYCGKLKAIDINLCRDIFLSHSQHLWQRALVGLFRKLENLKSLKFSDNFLHQHDFFQDLPDSIQNLSAELRQTSVDAVVASPVTLDFIKFHNLQSLTLNGHKIHDLNGIEKLTRLIHLDFCNSAVPCHVIKKIEKLSSLQTLKISSYNIDIDDNTFMKIIRNLQQLQCLDISGHSSLTDRSLQLISTLPNLKILDISSLSRVTLMYMDEMSSLEKLECEMLKNITDEKMCRLIELASNLRYLNVSSCSITTNLFIMVNAVVEKRQNNAVLEIITNQCVDRLDETQQLSPLLKIESSWEPPLPFYGSWGDDDEDDISNEISYDFYDDNGFF